jgi:hypothetical protein
MVVVVPVDGHVHEAQRVASVPSRKYRLLSALRVICREDHWDGAANQAVTG